MKKKVKLRFDAINYNSPTSKTAILKTEKGIKSDSILVKMDVKRISSKLKDF